MSAVIEYLCASPVHQLPDDVASPVIMYAERWAYCPAGTIDGHDWRATGGKTLTTVRDWLGRPVGPQEQHAPRMTGVGR